jgi:hypothetical protein
MRSDTAPQHGRCRPDKILHRCVPLSAGRRAVSGSHRVKRKPGRVSASQWRKPDTRAKYEDSP